MKQTTELPTQPVELPKECFGVRHRGLIKLQLGKKSYVPVHTGPNMLNRMKAKGLNDMDDIADHLNAEAHITKPQRLAMQYGSMWGFDTPKATAEFWDPKFKKGEKVGGSTITIVEWDDEGKQWIYATDTGMTLTETDMTAYANPTKAEQ